MYFTTWNGFAVLKSPNPIINSPNYEKYVVHADFWSNLPNSPDSQTSEQMLSSSSASSFVQLSASHYRVGGNRVGYEDLDRAAKKNQEGEACQLYGFFDTAKVPGNFHIAFSSAAEEMLVGSPIYSIGGGLSVILELKST